MAKKDKYTPYCSPFESSSRRLYSIAFVFDFCFRFNTTQFIGIRKTNHKNQLIVYHEYGFLSTLLVHLKPVNLFALAIYNVISSTHLNQSKTIPFFTGFSSMNECKYSRMNSNSNHIFCIFDF